ncbi:MAG: alpha-L-fucosidase [Lentisphaerae bacterium]|jgi:alpha-L-fucosidase|nr:alpha-L-fucosidase [Lentisphaerota bacterium]
MKTGIPTPLQLEYQDLEFGIFVHFGIRTFYEGHRDWDGKAMEPSQFLPSQLNCDQWASVASAAGAKYMVMTAKHHDGFANWPSKMTDFSVAGSSWKGGEGDVVAEYVEACRRHGLKVGLYYSPMDASGKRYDDPKAYDDYFIGQISELLVPYGKIDILWFDGCGSGDHRYDWPRICSEIRRMQPEILIFSMGDPNFRWVGNELGIAPQPIWNTVEGSEGRPKWLPAECDCRMRLQNWFYSDHDADTVKGVAELMGLYYLSVGRGCNLLLNIGPDRRGLFPDPDVLSLLEFGREVKRRFGKPIATLSDFGRDGLIYQKSFGAPVLADHVVLMEDLVAGEHVFGYRIEANPNHSGEWIELSRGTSLGHKAIRRFPQLAVRQLRVVLESESGDASLRGLDVFRCED